MATFVQIFLAAVLSILGLNAEAEDSITGKAETATKAIFYAEQKFQLPARKLNKEHGIILQQDQNIITLLE